MCLSSVFYYPLGQNQGVQATLFFVLVLFYLITRCCYAALQPTDLDLFVA